MILATCQCQHILCMHYWVEPSLLLSSLHFETHFFNIYLTLPSLAMVIFWLIHPSRVVNKHLPKEFEEQRKPHHSEWHLCSSMRTHPSTIMETIKRKRSSQAAFTFTEALLKLIYLSPEKKYIYSSTFLWPDNSKGPCAVPTNPKHRQRHLQKVAGSSFIGEYHSHSHSHYSHSHSHHSHSHSHHHHHHHH